MLGKFLSCIKGFQTFSRLKSDGGISLEMPLQKRASFHVEGRISWFFSSCCRKHGVPLELQWGPQGPAHVASGKSSLHASCEGPLGIPLQSVPGLKSSSEAEAGTSGFLSSVLTWILGFLSSFNMESGLVSCGDMQVCFPLEL